MARRIKLVKSQVQNVNFQYLGAFRLRIEVTEAYEMDRNVFVYRRDSPTPNTTEVKDTFFAVASPVDMEEYPPGAPDPKHTFPFFRLAFVELDLRAVSLADSVWSTIKSEVCALVNGLDLLERLRPIEEFWCPGPPPPPEPPPMSISSVSSAGSIAGLEG